MEKEIFIEQMKDVIDKAEDMLSEDTEGERSSDQGASPQQADSFKAEMREVQYTHPIWDAQCLSFWITQNTL